MDIRSLIKIAGLTSISLGSAIFTSHTLANVNADTNSEDRFWIDRTYQNLSKVNNFQASTKLTLSNSAAPMVTELTFKQPDNFYQVVTQPETVKGYEASYSNQTIILHDRPNKRALQIKGLKRNKDKSGLSRIKGIYLFNKEHYEQTFTPSIHVADRLSVGIDFDAKDKGFEIKKIEGFADYHYSLFMQANFIFNSGIEAQVKNTHVEFNKEKLTLPTISVKKIQAQKDTQIISWNLSKKGLSQKKAEEKISQDIVWPEDKKNTWDFSEHKYYQKNGSKNAAAYYHSDEFFLITTTEPSPQNKLASTAVGIPLMLEETHARLNQFPAFSSLEFSHNGIHYTLLTNTHPESLITMAKDMVIKK